MNSFYKTVGLWLTKFEIVQKSWQSDRWKRSARINLKEIFFSQTNHMQVKVASFFEMFCYILDKETDTKRCFDHNKTLFVVI